MAMMTASSDYPPVPEYDHLFKIIIIGDSGCGKSCLLMRFADDTFEDRHISTIGVDFKIRTIRLEGRDIKLHLWDTSGCSRFQNITSSYYRNAQGIVLVYDTTDSESFANINYWLEQVDRYGHSDAKPTMILVGTKCDLDTKRQVDVKEANKLAFDLDIPHVECSAKKNYNVDKVFTVLSGDLRDKMVKTLDPKSDKPLDIRSGVTLDEKKDDSWPRCCT